MLALRRWIGNERLLRLRLAYLSQDGRQGAPLAINVTHMLKGAIRVQEWQERSLSGGLGKFNLCLGIFL